MYFRPGMNPRGARWLTWTAMAVLTAIAAGAAVDSPWTLVVLVPVLAFVFLVLKIAEDP